jgi:hypothetical protein
LASLISEDRQKYTKCKHPWFSSAVCPEIPSAKQTCVHESASKSQLDSWVHSEVVIHFASGEGRDLEFGVIAVERFLLSLMKGLTVSPLLV